MRSLAALIDPRRKAPLCLRWRSGASAAPARRSAWTKRRAGRDMDPEYCYQPSGDWQTRQNKLAKSAADAPWTHRIACGW